MGVTGSGFGSPRTHALREIDQSDPAARSRLPIGYPPSAPLAVLPPAPEFIDTGAPGALQAASPTVRTRFSLPSAIERDSNGTQCNEHTLPILVKGRDDHTHPYVTRCHRRRSAAAPDPV